MNAMEIRPTPRKEELSTDGRNAERTLAIAEAVSLAVADPHAVLDIVLRAEDRSAAQAALQQRFHLDPEQAYAILDLQFGRVTRSDRVRVAAWAREARAFLDAQPDPGEAAPSS